MPDLDIVMGPRENDQTVTLISPSAAVIAALCIGISAEAQSMPSGPVIDAKVRSIMTATRAKGIAVAVIDGGEVRYVHAYGSRNAKGLPLTTDPVMYGASITKKPRYTHQELSR